MAGHKIIWANDHNKDAVETYKYNIGNEIVCGDIEKIDISNIPKADVLVGGFPCQGFSQANLKRCGKDKRNILYKYFLKVLKRTKPKFFIAENVRGILSIEKGKVIKHIIKEFQNVGYTVKVELINCADYGVPQTRSRVFILGTHKKLNGKTSLSMPPKTHSRNHLNGLSKWVPIKNALKNIPEPGKTNKLPNHVYSKYKVTNRNFTGHRKTNPNKPSPTILARGNGKGGVCAIQHFKNHRRMSVREQAVIQTFPLRFKFFGSLNSCYRQVGNAVPVKIGYILGNALRQNEEYL